MGRRAWADPPSLACPTPAFVPFPLGFEFDHLLLQQLMNDRSEWNGAAGRRAMRGGEEEEEAAGRMRAAGGSVRNRCSGDGGDMARKGRLRSRRYRSWTEVGKFYGSYRESRQGGKFVFKQMK